MSSTNIHDDPKLFECYSPALFLFLRAQGLVPTGSSVHRKTGNHFATFLRTEELSRALNEWRANRPN